LCAVSTTYAARKFHVNVFTNVVDALADVPLAEFYITVLQSVTNSCHVLLGLFSIKTFSGACLVLLLVSNVTKKALAKGCLGLRLVG
jgi:hypothetical protein